MRVYIKVKTLVLRGVESVLLLIKYNLDSSIYSAL